MSFDCSAPTAASARRSPIPTHPTALSTARPTPATHRSQRQGPHSKDDGQQPPHHDHHNDRKINDPRRQRPDQLPSNRLDSTSTSPGRTPPTQPYNRHSLSDQPTRALTLR